MLGVSGAGKTHLGRLLKFLGFHFIDMSSELERRAYEWHDQNGEHLKDWLERGRALGELVNDQAVQAVLAAAIREAREDQSIIISGCPRTVKQAELAVATLARYVRKSNVLVVTLEVNLEEATRRALEGDDDRRARVDSTRERVATSHAIFLESNALICAELMAYGIECVTLNADGDKAQVEQALLALIEPHWEQ